MRVAILGAVLGMGGVEQHILNLAIGLRRLGHDAHIVGLVNAGGFDELREWADPHTVIPLTWVDGGIEGNGLQTVLSRLRPDMLSAQLPFPGLPLEGVGTSIVWTAHGRYSICAPPPRRGPIVCVDRRIMEIAKGLAREQGAWLVHNGIDLDRFTFRGDSRTRAGVAYLGRWDEPKLAGVRAVAARVNVDVWGTDGCDDVPGLKLCGKTRSEEVCYRYRVVIASGLCALEAMACGALLLTNTMTERSLRELSDASFSPRLSYPQGEEGQAQYDLETLLRMGADEALDRALLQRRWIESHHDCTVMARKFVEVYEGART